MTFDNCLAPLSDYLGTKTRLKFNGSCSKQPKLTCTHGNTVNFYIVYELGASSSFDDDRTLKSSFFGAVILSKNADIDKYQYSGYGIGFGAKSSFSFPGDGFGQNVIIFGVDMSSYVDVDNKKEHFNSWKMSNARLRWAFVNWRINVFN